jgi:hypothetical protein
MMAYLMLQTLQQDFLGKQAALPETSVMALLISCRSSISFPLEAVVASSRKRLKPSTFCLLTAASKFYTYVQQSHGNARGA